MLILHWALILVYIIIVATAAIAVLLDNRQPEKTMAWVLVLLFFPIGGVVLYFFFGQNTRRKRHISQHSLDELSKRQMLEFVEQRDLRIPPECRPLMQLFANQSMALPFKDNEVEIYTDGHEYFPALLAAISQAKHHIHIDTFIMENDPLGRLVADALIAKAHEGVEVRLIYDDVGCWRVSGRFFNRMRREGIDVRPFMPVKFPAFTSKVNYRNHRKLCIVDGRTAFIGGMNIARRYVSGQNGHRWRDTHLQVRGGAVYAVQCAFLIDWYFVSRTLITDRRYYPAQPATLPRNNCLAQVVTSSPIARWPDIMQGYMRILLEARSYVYIETPYFLPTEPVLYAMRTAAIAGVDVRLMVPSHCDAKLVEWASHSYVCEALEAGVSVYFYNDGFNHSKLLVSDDKVCTCGSSNVDFRSFENNFEANIFFYDRNMAQRIKRVFERDMEHCIVVHTVDQLPRNAFHTRLWMSLVRLLSPLL